MYQVLKAFTAETTISIINVINTRNNEIENVLKSPKANKDYFCDDNKKLRGQFMRVHSSA